MNSAIDQKLSFCNGGICDIKLRTLHSIKHVREVGACCMLFEELAHLLCKFYVKEMGFKAFL